MGPFKSPTGAGKEQAPGRRKRQARRRRCLLKGCEQRFYPRYAQQRYCGAECRGKAQQWKRWKAQQKYRGTDSGKQKRNGQSRRYRERVKKRQDTEKIAVAEPARVIPSEEFFRAQLRSAGVL